jgi:hypothetical protein
MKANTLLAASLVALLSLSSTGQCELIMFFDPADLSVTSTGMDQTVDLGILIDYDGSGDDTLSGFTLGFSESSPSLDVIPAVNFASDFTWGGWQCRQRYVDLRLEFCQSHDQHLRDSAAGDVAVRAG